MFLISPAVYNFLETEKRKILFSFYKEISKFRRKIILRLKFVNSSVFNQVISHMLLLIFEMNVKNLLFLSFFFSDITASFEFTCNFSPIFKIAILSGSISSLGEKTFVFRKETICFYHANLFDFCR